MNYRFRKLPVVIEAFKMTAERRWDNSEWPNWMHQAWNMELDEEGSLFCGEIDNGNLYIRTLEGVQLISWGDWIIQGIQGEIYPCRPDIFMETYEEAE